MQEGWRQHCFICKIQHQPLAFLF